MTSPSSISVAENERPRTRKWSLPQPNIEDLEPFPVPQCCYLPTPPDTLMARYRYSTPVRFVLNCLCLPVYLGVLVVTETIDYSSATSDRVLRKLASRRRRNVCERARTHDLAQLPSSRPKVTQRNQGQSCLLRLPLELRLLIWVYVFSPAADIAIFEAQRVLQYRLCNNISQQTLLTLPLTCRQLYAETITYIYSKNSFHYGESVDRQLFLSLPDTTPPKYMRLGNPLVISLPDTIPLKHLQAMTSLRLTCGLDSLVAAMHLPDILGDEKDGYNYTTHYAIKAAEQRSKYRQLWHFLATNLQNLETLIITFEAQIRSKASLERSICQWILDPLYQYKDGNKEETLWSPRLKLFEVRFGSEWMKYLLYGDHDFLLRIKKERPPFFPRQACKRSLDWPGCVLCRMSKEYFSGSEPGMWAIVSDAALSDLL